MALGGGTWAVPADDATDDAIGQVRVLIDRAGGELLVFDAKPRDPETTRRLVASYTDGVEAQWLEFLADCEKYRAELERETRIKKFTLAELEEEEQSLERLQRWYATIAARDRYKAPSTTIAARRLKQCEKELDTYATRVYRVVNK